MNNGKRQLVGKLYLKMHLYTSTSEIDK